jgi:hypothetical protein
MGEDFLQVMWHEYCARDGFCMQLRVDLVWDKAAFDRLTEAMRLCCKQYEILSAQQHKEQMERARNLQAQSALPGQSDEKRAESEDDLSPSLLPETRRLLPDWQAELFWFLSHFVRDWTSHNAWKQDVAREPDYFHKAYQRLNYLASWFFTGSCPWLDEERGWASTFVR